MPDTHASGRTRVGFVSLGCPKNLVDTEVMLGTLVERGCEITHDRHTADVIVVNTCGFIDSAKEESIDTILEMARLRTEGRCRKLVVAGCLAERYRDQIVAEIPEVDVVFGPDELGRILEALAVEDGANDGAEEPGKSSRSGVSIDALYTSREIPTIPRLRTTPAHLAYFKISEGCDHTCAFCAIPGFRGAFRSRRLEDLLREARGLAGNGTRELVLVSQDTLAWGKDLEGSAGIAALLEGLLGIPDLRWIRLLYNYPNLLSDQIVDLIGKEERLCSYFDIPYQHASPRILARMRRGGGRAAFMRQVEEIRRRVPKASLRTSFIVGFPGEEQSDFEELVRFVGDAAFDHLGVFLYSDEEGTAAYGLEPQVPREVAIERRNILMERQSGIARRRLSCLVGHSVPVLLDGLSGETDLLLEGRTEGQAPEIDGRVLINDSEVPDPRTGEFYLTQITDVLDYDLLGRIVSGC
jgi:ribosomal protein S12 methylthiotransferase